MESKVNRTVQETINKYKYIFPIKTNFNNLKKNTVLTITIKLIQTLQLHQPGKTNPKK